MKALVYEKPGRENGRVKEIPVPEYGENQVLIKVMSCGICKPAERTHDANGSVLGRYPAIPGHEMAGVVEKIGNKVKYCRPGDRVTLDNGIACGNCYYCKKGEPLFCDNFGSMGHNLQGGMAEYIVADEVNVYKIPDGVSYDQAALCELIGCCLRAVERSRVQYCDSVLILGAGASGMILAQLFKNSGAGSVSATDRVESKLKLMEKKGVRTYRLKNNDYGNLIEELKEGEPEGFDIIVNACGAVEAGEAALACLKKGGTYVGYSFPDGEEKGFVCNVPDFIKNEWTYVGSTFNREFEKCLEILKIGKVDCDCLITGHYPLEKYFEALDENLNDENSLKIIIHPNGH